MHNNITLIGNPNSGKTKLFNLLTNSNQKVGNWAGVTVDIKQGKFITPQQTFDITDLPGIYALHNKIPSLDEKVAQDFIKNNPDNLFLNIVDASNLERAIYLTTSLREQGVKMIVLLNMMDIVDKKNITIDIEKLSQKLGCVVIPMSLKDGFDTNVLVEQIGNYKELNNFTLQHQISDTSSQNNENKYKAAKTFIQDVIIKQKFIPSISDTIDNIVVGRFSGVLVFFAMMYALFLFSINIGGAFIDFFDILAGAIFIDGMEVVLTSINTPQFVIAIITAIGGGIQVVATFIPIIGALYLFLTLLEESGYMARAAFVMDRFMRSIGLSGKAFVPLIVGFGCNVPGIMATRTLGSRQERITTILMSPFMSCGARLAVYVLFATVFFPESGTLVVFLLYIIGIILAIITGLILKKGFSHNENYALIMELPAYQTPRITDILKNTWNKLKDFIIGAGKIIVIVVALINIADNIGTDGSFNNQNSQNSILSASAQVVTPVFKPIGIQEDNWEAVVGVITGLLAKEVVVGTLDALYSSSEDDGSEFDFSSEINAAFISISDNFKTLTDAVLDPLGLSAIDSTLEEQEVANTTTQVMQEKFDGQIGAFAYLLFILLYFPCVAAFGAMMREGGNRWGILGALWSTTLAYSIATIFYQIATWTSNPVYASVWIVIAIVMIVIFIKILNTYARTSTEIEVMNR